MIENLHSWVDIYTQNDNFINYCYIIFNKNTKEALVIDPSWEIDKINNVILQNNLKLKWILLTHSHNDHTNLVNCIIEKYNSQVFISESESLFYNYKCTNLKCVKDNENLFLGNMLCQCILTPGHTVGSMCFLIGNYIFTGDTLFTEGCGVCDGNGGSAEEMYDSIQKLKEIIKPNIKVYPAHSFGMILGKKMSDLYDLNIYLNISNKDIFVNFRNMTSQNTYTFK